MWNYLRESLHWLYLTFCKPTTLAQELKKLTRFQRLIALLKTYPVAALIYSVILVGLGVGVSYVGFSFNWSAAFIWFAFGLGMGLVLSRFINQIDEEEVEVFQTLGCLTGLVGGGVVSAYFVNGEWWLASIVLGGLLGTALIGIVQRLLIGQFSSVLVGALGLGLIGGLKSMLGAGLCLGLLGLLGRKPIDGYNLGVGGALTGLLIWRIVDFQTSVTGHHLDELIQFSLAYLPVFLFTFFRPFYVPIHILQLGRSENAVDPFLAFRNSPIYWDEAIAALPYLRYWLRGLLHRDREKGIRELQFIIKQRHFQRESAIQVLLEIVQQDLGKINKIESLTITGQLLKNFPSEVKNLPTGLDDTKRRLNTISYLAEDFISRTTNAGKLRVLEALHNELDSFRLVISENDSRYRQLRDIFKPQVNKWVNLLKISEDEYRQQVISTLIPNSFIVGNPVKVGEEEVFKGRHDIVVAIEEYILSAKQRPTLLLYGRRRTGKSSTLLNLPRLLSRQLVPVYIDCQNAKSWGSDVEFCCYVATAIYHELFQRDLLDGLRQPRLENFEKYAFTRLDEFLDEVETLSQKIRKQILLTFDEYERLEKGITANKISEAVLNQLRTIIQHRKRIVVLVSGAHRFEELKALNWSDYLINAKTLELSYLERADAIELLTEPVPNLEYGAGVLEKIIEFTHCQPFLLQAVASDLVNYLNAQKRQHATLDDLNIAVEKVVVTADVYFYNTWDDCSADEQEILRILATAQSAQFREPAQINPAHGLIRKEIIEREDNDYRLSVALFGRWIIKNQIAEA